MKHPMKHHLAVALASIGFGQTVKSVDEKVQEAVKNLTRREAEAEYHRRMADFYTERAMAIGLPQNSATAQDLADAYKAREDHQADWQVEFKRIGEAHAILEAREAQLAQLRNPAPKEEVSNGR